MSKSLAALRAAAQMALAEHGETHHITRALNETIGRIEREQTEQAELAQAEQARTTPSAIPTATPGSGIPMSWLTRQPPKQFSREHDETGPEFWGTSEAN